MKRHLLIVEDDEFVQDLLAAYMRSEGYKVSQALDGGEMIATLEAEAVDLILLDLGLPDEDGLALIRRVRTRSSVPIIVLTSSKERGDRLAALDLGANDYLSKPCDPEELALRVRNLMGTGDDGKTIKTDDVVEFEGWSINLSAVSLTSPSGVDVHLTSAEFNTLAALAKSRGRVLSRDFLLDAISRGDESPSDRTIDVVISRLRKKVEDDPKSPRLIVTVSGHGYKLSA